MPEGNGVRPLLAAVGMPGVLSAWGFALVEALAREAFGTFTTIRTDKLDELISARASATGRADVLISQFPERALIEVLLGQREHIVVFVESAADSVRYLARSAHQPDIALVRAVSASLACMTNLADKPGVMICRRDTIGQSPLINLILSISRHFRLRLTAETFARDLSPLYRAPGRTPLSPFELVAPHLVADYVSRVENDAGPSTSTEKLIASALVPLDKWRADAKRAVKMVWPGEVFSVAGWPEQNSTVKVPIAGGARCLIYGPYLHLPPGRWCARILVDFEVNAGDERFAIEVVAREVISAAQIRPPLSGLFALSIVFQVEKPEVSLEIRVSLQSGAIEGAISLLSVELSRVEEFSMTTRRGSSDVHVIPHAGDQQAQYQVARAQHQNNNGGVL
jgi:hypothetical protein